MYQPSWLAFLQGAVVSIAMNLLTGIELQRPPLLELLAIAALVAAAVVLYLAMRIVENALAREKSLGADDARRRQPLRLVVAGVLAVGGMMLHAAAQPNAVAVCHSGESGPP